MASLGSFDGQLNTEKCSMHTRNNIYLRYLFTSTDYIFIVLQSRQKILYVFYIDIYIRFLYTDLPQTIFRNIFFSFLYRSYPWLTLFYQISFSYGSCGSKTGVSVLVFYFCIWPGFKMTQLLNFLFKNHLFHWFQDSIWS